MPSSVIKMAKDEKNIFFLDLLESCAPACFFIITNYYIFNKTTFRKLTYVFL